jgi:HipA-like protein
MARTPLRQLRLVISADVYKAGVLAGTLRRLHDRTEFSYLADYLDGASAVAWSLPPRAEAFIAPAAAVPAFFAGLLPEGGIPDSSRNRLLPRQIPGTVARAGPGTAPPGSPARHQRQDADQGSHPRPGTHRKATRGAIVIIGI